jgi:G:T-mismatch repair DNA endonuclease (very short patch repair protein)
MLKAEGWRILVVWDSDIIRKKTREDTLRSIADFLAERS